MPLFRRNHGASGAGRDRGLGSTSAAGSRAGSRDPTLSDEGKDWRSYGPIAEAYQRIFAPRFEATAADLVDVMGIVPGARVLDVGTGTGVVARRARAAAGDGSLVVGIDPSPGMLAVATRQGGGAAYAAAEAIDLPFRDGTFAYVVSEFVLHHFTKYDTALFDMMRVLAPRGRMGVTTWGPNQDELTAAWEGVAEEFAEREMFRDARKTIAPWDELLGDPNRLKDVLHDAGLREIRVDRREYRFEYTREEYLASREITPGGRFLRQMLGDESWGRLRERAKEVFAERFPPSFNDFRDVNLAVGTKP